MNLPDPGVKLGSPALQVNSLPTELSGKPNEYSRAFIFLNYWASLVAQLVKNLPAMQETPVQFLGQEDPLEKGKATHSNILVWRIPWTVKSMGSQRVGHD